MPKKFLVFLDTSVILSGLNSPSGASAAILAAAHGGSCIAVISPQVIEEAERNIFTKFPKLKSGWVSFLLIPPEIASAPSIQEITRAYEIIPTSDAPILASALKTRVNVLVTLDKDFLNIKNGFRLSVLSPSELLEEMRSQKLI